MRVVGHWKLFGAQLNLLACDYSRLLNHSRRRYFTFLKQTCNAYKVTFQGDRFLADNVVSFLLERLEV